MNKPKQQLPKSLRLAIKYYSFHIRAMNAVSTKWAAQKAVELFIKPHTNEKLKLPEIFELAMPLQLIANGIKINGYEWKSKAPHRKKALVVHGFAGNCRKFDTLIKALLDKGFSVVAYDAPAHGHSEGKVLHGFNYKTVIESIIKKHGAFDTYLGHSLGGQSIMLALENLGWKNNPKIVLLAPATEATTAADIFFEFLQLNVKIRAAFDAIVLRDSSKPLEWYSIKRILPKCPCQILWVHDEDDPTTPIKDVLPLVNTYSKKIDFYFTKGLGHSKIYRNKKVIEKVMSFLIE